MSMPIDTDGPANEPGQDAQNAITETSPFQTVQLVFSSLANTFIAETPEERRKLFEVVHRNLIIFDDYLCETFGFSRKPRGRYDRKKERG